MRVAILGAGFIGKNLLTSYISQGMHVSVLDRNICPEEFKCNVHWVQGSFFNKDDIKEAIEKAEIVYHLISSTVPGDQIDETEELYTNVASTINFLKICVEKGVRRVVFISSSAVYGLQRRMPIPETAATDPISSHGIHKLTIEKYMNLYRYNYGLDCKIMRLSNPYGPNQNVYGRQGFIAIVLGKILMGEPVVIRGDGTATRDFLYMDDVVQACHLLGKTDSNEAVFNIGSGKGITINETVDIMRQISKKNIEVIYSEGRGGDIQASILDISKAREILGYEPRVTLAKGLEKLFYQYKVY